MSNVTQKCVPIHAAKLAWSGDARALLAIPDARRHFEKYPHYYGSYRIDGYRASRYDYSGSVDTVTAGRAAEIVRERLRRREARGVAEAARVGTPGRILAMKSAPRVQIVRTLWKLRPAKTKDARVLLAMPDARTNVEALVAGKRHRREGDALTAAEIGTPKAVAAAKALIAARVRRRADRAVAETARTAEPGRYAARAATKREEERKRVVGLVASSVDRLLDKYYRCATSSWAGGDNTNHVTLSDEPGATASTNRSWSKNGKWSGLNLTRRVKVSPRWLDDVQAKGIAVVDGLVTTHAALIESADPAVELYRATWIRQGRGMEIRHESGILARHVASGTTYHSVDVDPKKASSGLKRKLAAQGVPAEVRTARAQAAAATRAAKRADGIARLVERLTKWDFSEIAHVVVEREHSLKAGNCEPGTDAFIERFFPDKVQPRATIGEIASRVGTLDPSLLRGADLTLARQLAAAALVAIRKDRQARRAVLA